MILDQRGSPTSHPPQHHAAQRSIHRINLFDREYSAFASARTKAHPQRAALATTYEQYLRAAGLIDFED
ncbi:hypothetical protein ACCT30_20715, partial [Rhizobium ruizarguesonis]